MYVLLGIAVLGFTLLVVTDFSIVSNLNRPQEDVEQAKWITSYNNSSGHSGDLKLYFSLKYRILNKQLYFLYHIYERNIFQKLLCKLENFHLIKSFYG